MATRRFRRNRRVLRKTKKNQRNRKNKRKKSHGGRGRKRKIGGTRKEISIQDMRRKLKTVNNLLIKARNEGDEEEAAKRQAEYKNLEERITAAAATEDLRRKIKDVNILLKKAKDTENDEKAAELSSQIRELEKKVTAATARQQRLEDKANARPESKAEPEAESKAGPEPRPELDREKFEKEQCITVLEKHEIPDKVKNAKIIILVDKKNKMFKYENQQ